MLTRHANFLFLKTGYPVIKLNQFMFSNYFHLKKANYPIFVFAYFLFSARESQCCNFSLIDDKLFVFMTPQNRVNYIYFLTLLLVIYLFNSPAKSYTLFQKYCQIINRNILELTFKSNQCKSSGFLRKQSINF